MQIGEDNFVKEIKNKNEDALEYVMDEYGGLLKSIIKRMLCHLPQLQEECLSDTFLRIWIHIEQFDPKRSSFKNWAAGIARYRAIDYIRKYVVRTKELNWDQITVPTEDARLRQVLESEAQEALEELLKPLNKKDRELFMMIYGQRLSAQDAAKKMNMKTSAVYNHLTRGRCKLRKTIESAKADESKR